MVEGALQTVSFQAGRILFDELPAPSENRRCTPQPDMGGDYFTGVYHPLTVFYISQPTFTKWTWAGEGLGPQEIGLSDSLTSPFRAKREWSEARVDKHTAHFDIAASVKHEATITLTHTPG